MYVFFTMIHDKSLIFSKISIYERLEYAALWESRLNRLSVNRI